MTRTRPNSTSRLGSTAVAVLQRKCACGDTCPKCATEEKKGLLQRSATRSGDVGEVPPIVYDVLREPGQPLDAGTRSFFEPRFGADFGSVRVHSGPKAAASAAAVNAEAYTVGQDIVVDQRYWRSSTNAELVAHELSHTSQQRGSSHSGQLTIAPTDHWSEVEAATTAHNVVGGRGVASVTGESAFGQSGQLNRQARPQGTPHTVAPDPNAKEAAKLETEILANSTYRAFPADAKANVDEIVRLAKGKPLGQAQGERNYYLIKLKVALTTPFAGKKTSKVEYGCSKEAEKANRKEVEDALQLEKLSGLKPDDTDEKSFAAGKNKVERLGQGGKKFSVDASDPKNVLVQIKVKLNGDPKDVAKIKSLEDAIERSIGTQGYHLDIVFVTASGLDVFEFTVNFCEWANSGNWASGPQTLSHEVHHALGLGDRYDYIESHADNRQLNPEMRVHWFLEQMRRTGVGPRDAFSKMDTNSNQLLSEDVCAVAFPPGPDQKNCIKARKDLDPVDAPPLP